MTGYLSLVSRYLAAHKKRTTLTMLSVALSIALVTGVFSMGDAFLQFEKIQIIHDYGNYHILVQNPSEEEMTTIRSRSDIKNSGLWRMLKQGSIQDVPCELGALDENFAENMNIRVIEGKYPTGENEIMLEQWAMERFRQKLRLHDIVRLKFANGLEKEFVISGIYNDLGNMKAKAVPGVLLSMAAVDAAGQEEGKLFLMEFKPKANIIKAEEELKNDLRIDAKRIMLNDRLLAVMGQGTHAAAVGLYQVGAVLAALVLIAGVVMMYNTFNISVTERVRQFGLLRCIGASGSQIRKLVRREGLLIALRAIPVGALGGMLITFACCAVLKFFNVLFKDMPLLVFSLPGIAAGVVIGLLTVYIASAMPARKAARVSPVNAVTGSNDMSVRKNRKKGVLTRTFRIETAMGIGNAFIRKKTFILMSCSVAISIILFSGFQVLVSFLHSGMKVTKPYTPDITLASEQAMDDRLFVQLSALEGISNVCRRMFGYVNVSFDAARLTDAYRTEAGNIMVNGQGLFAPPQASWLISYDQKQLDWAREDLVKGELSEEKMNTQNGIIAVNGNLYKGIQSINARLQPGDAVFVETPAGIRELKVMGVLSKVPFSDSKENFATWIVTEKQFATLTDLSEYKVIDIQLKNKDQEQTVKAIRNLAGESITFMDMRQKNTEMDQTFFTMALFIYGFVSVIALISILNIVNTMNTSVSQKRRYLGVMRAVGMSGKQLNKMVLAEAAVYNLTGCITGCTLGILLQKSLIENQFSSMSVPWSFPVLQIVVILAAALCVTALSVLSPLKKAKAINITEAVNSL